MREMKDSGIEWVGQTPKGWELRRAKTLFTQRNSKGNEIEVLLSPTQKYGVVPQSQLEGVVQVKEDADLQMFKTVHKGDFVISLRSFQGGFEYSLYEGVCSPAYQVFYPTSPICDTYYRYLFKSQSFISKMNNLTVGIREGKNIQYVDFANSQIPVPPLAEQERIAAFLDAECAEIDTVLEKTRASIEEYKKLKQAVITQAVTKGIRGDRPMKDSGIEWIGDIQKGWGSSTIAQLCSQVKYKNTGLQEKNLLSLSYGKVKRKSIDTVEGLLPESFDGYNIIEKDDIVLRLTDLQNDHTSLRVGLAEERGIITSAYLTIRNRSNICTKYLYYYLHSFDIAKGFYGMGAGVRQGLNWDGVKWLKVLVPSVPEQEHIVAFLDAESEKLDALIAKKQQYLTEIENYKKSLIYEYVTGKREVV